jgi:hypothetical protein
MEVKSLIRICIKGMRISHIAISLKSLMFKPEVDLVAELCWLELLGAEDDVAARVLHVVSRHIPRKENITYGKQSLL